MLFALELAGVENGISQDVAEDVEAEADIGLQHTGKVRGRLDAGCRVDLAPDRLDLLNDLRGGAAAGALEGHMFQEMAETVFAVLLGPGTGADPYAERGALQMIHPMRDHPEAGLQRCQPDGHWLESFRPTLGQFCFSIGEAIRRRNDRRPIPPYRSRSVRRWAPANRKPEGTGYFAPIPTRCLSTVSRYAHRALDLISSQNRSVRMAQSWLKGL